MNKYWLVPFLSAAIYGSYLYNLIPEQPPHHSAEATQTQTTPPEKPAPNADQQPELVELERLRNELDTLERQIAQRERLKQSRQTQKSEEYTFSLSKGGLTPDQLEYSGYTSPMNSIETLLWAGVAGDTQVMFDSVTMGEESADIAKRFFELLPEDIRSGYNSPLQLIAALTISDIPLTHVRAVKSAIDPPPLTGNGNKQTSKGDTPVDDNTASQRLVFTSNVDRPIFVQLQLEKQQNEEWKISIPSSAIRKYANELGISLETQQIQPTR